MTAYCHKLIKQVAQEMAGAVYEQCAQNDAFYRVWPSQQRFIRAKWGQFRDQARSTLAGMLESRTLTEAQKDEIAEALVLDWGLPEKTAKPAGIALQ